MVITTTSGSASLQLAEQLKHRAGNVYSRDQCIPAACRAQVLTKAKVTIITSASISIELRYFK